MRLVCMLLLMSFTLHTHASERTKKIRQFIKTELESYPLAQLTDLYKNYFQDAYGPGHLIPDTIQAGSYLDWELNQTDWKDTTRYQPLGTNHDFYRINLWLVKNGTIPRDILLTAIVKSATMARRPEIDDWKREWQEVLAVIKETQPALPHLQTDEKQIEETLSKGEVVIHHSTAYENAYHPHYRIVHRTIFEGWKNLYLKKIP